MHADGETPSGLRAGGTVLSLLAGPLSVPILSAHLDGPLRLPDLRERIDGAAQTTLRGQVGNLRAVGALERQVRSGMPYTVENELTECGREILDVAKFVEAWLSRAPRGPIALGSEAAKGVLRALVAGWDSTVLRALAASPLSLTELSTMIEGLSYPSLERRLSAMRAARQIEVRSNSGGKSKPYEVTDWTRHAVTPLVAASRCECRHLTEVARPLAQADIETAFLLAVPLASLPPECTGSCVFAVIPADGEAVGDETMRVGGVQIEVVGGEVTSCVPGLEREQGQGEDQDQDQDAGAFGAVEAWAKAIAEGDLDELRIEDDGDDDIARPLVEGICSALRPAAA